MKTALAIAAVALLFAEGLSAQDNLRRAPEPAQPESQPSTSTGFQVCNRTGTEVEVAKALNMSSDGKPVDFVSEGWYKIAPGQCATVWTGKLAYRYYLLYAQNKSSGKEWKGDISVCVSREAFTIRQGYCGGQSYRRMFFQIDTGESESWTQNLRP